MEEALGRPTSFLSLLARLQNALKRLERLSEEEKMSFHNSIIGKYFDRDKNISSQVKILHKQLSTAGNWALGRNRPPLTENGHFFVAPERAVSVRVGYKVV